MTLEQKIIEIFNKHEFEEQRNKLAEEYKEFQDELLMWKIGAKDLGNIASEAADVIVLILEFALSAGVETKDIEEWIDFKVDRQCKRDGITYEAKHAEK